MKKNILLLSLFFLLLNVNNIFSQNITIKGKIKKPIVNSQSLESKSLVRLMTFNDMLTFEQTTIFETKSDKEGKFTIEANISEITLAQIAVDLERVEILLKPNANYEIEIDIPSQDDNTSYFERKNPTLRMIKSSDDNLHYQYYISNAIIDDFVLENFNNLYRNRKIHLLDSIDVRIEKELGLIKSDFVRDNIRYRKAALQMVVNNDNAKKVINQHFNKQKILYSQAAYMNLLHEIFSNYLSSQHFNPSDLKDMLRLNYDKFSTYLKSKDVFLAENQNLAEIIIAWNLKRMYYEMPDEKKQILDYINIISNSTKNQRNKKLINDILRQINYLSFNSDAPQFSLKNKKGDIISLSDYKEDILVIQFVNQISSMTDYQFEELKRHSQLWGENIKIITIATKDSFKDFIQLFENKGYNWELLNLGNDILLLEKYRIITYPDYVIIGKDNKIGMSPAPAPDQYLDYHVERIYKYYYKK